MISDPIDRGPSAPVVLLVDDEEAIRTAMRRVLSRRGYEVVPAASGFEALEVLGRGTHVDVVLTDLSMPGLGGRALVDRLNAERPGLPVVLMSGYSGAEVEQAIAGAHAFLQKPFSLDDLTDTVARLLRDRDR